MNYSDNYVFHSVSTQDDEMSLKDTTIGYTNETFNLTYYQTFCSDLSEDEWKIYNKFSWWLEGVGISVVGSFGIMFNIIAIFVLMSQEMVTIRFNNLVVTLAIVDNLFLLTSIFYHTAHSFELQVKFSYIHQWVFAKFVYPWRGISMCCSAYITVALALDRYNAVSNPSKYKASMRSHTNPITPVLRCTLPIICLSILFNIPKYFDLDIKMQSSFNVTSLTNESISNQTQIYGLIATNLRKNKKFVLWYVNVANFIVTCFIPLASLIYLNGQLIWKRKKFLQRQIERRKSSVYSSEFRRYSSSWTASHTQQTIILHTIVIVFMLCHALRIALNIEEWITMEDNIKARELGCSNSKFWSTIAQTVSHLLLQINSGANFFIYSLHNDTFCKVLKQKTKNVFNSNCTNPREKPTNEPLVIYRNNTVSNSNLELSANCEIQLGQPAPV